MYKKIKNVNKINGGGGQYSQLIKKIGGGKNAYHFK